MIKPIPGYESQYAIDEAGNVYSLPRKVPSGIQNMVRDVPARVLKTNIDKKGRTIVQLYKNGKKTPYDVKRLVLKIFGNAE